ncbi:MAG: cation-translocating P-type ATPase [Candidatus Woesearchaeota archaeon]
MNKDVKTKYYNLSVEDIFKTLETSREGLSFDESEIRLKKFGYNEIKKENKLGAVKLFFSKFNSLLIYILLITALITLYLDQLIEFYSILIVIGFSVILGFIHEYRAEKSVEALAKLTSKSVDVIRKGAKIKVDTKKLVIGDVIILKRGLIAPADVRVIESSGLSMDESILTGESVPKFKYEKTLTGDLDVSEQENIVFGGTTVLSGSALGVVINTGFESQIGSISKTLSSIKKSKTPLQKKIDGMSARISYSVIMISIIALFILMFRGADLTSAMILVAALAIAGIPEEFPLALTMALSTGIKKMASKNAIVKDMGSVETLGTTTVICTDKTGTLTQNKMMVVKFNVGFEEFEVEGSLFDSKIKSNKKVDFPMFFESIINCSNAEFHKVKKEDSLYGDPTEGALIGLSRSIGLNEVIVRNSSKRIFEDAFDSNKKYMLTVHSKNNKNTAYLKGAFEKVISKCSFIRVNGKERKLSNKDKFELKKIVHNYSNEALRVLAIATKKVGGINKKDLNKSFVLEGVVGIQDPLREDVHEAIENCFNAGIRIIMVTGDHKNTAKAIANKLNLITKQHHKVLEGKDIDKLTDRQLDKIINDVAVFSRTTPEHKLRIVSSLQRVGEIVAMTGDGVNDAPALKKADIGVSMGKEGTDVAREASNIVLTDDAFSSIVEAVREGRTIYSNIRRFSYFLVSVNAAEVGLIFLAILLNLVTPLTALMILFINVIISSLPALGLSIEATHSKVMHNLPRRPDERVLSTYILNKMIVVVPVLIISALGLFLWELNLGGGNLEKAMTYAFLVIIIGELLHSFNARRLHTSIFDRELLKNKYFYSGLGLALILVLLSIYNPWLSSILGTASISIFDWVIVVLVSSPVLFVSEFIKYMIRSELDEQRRERGTIYTLE